MNRLWLVLWAFSLLIGAEQASAATGDVWLDPATPTVALSANFTLEIRVDSGTDKVGAYTFNLGFDPSRLQVNAGVGDNGVQVGADGMPVNVVNLDNGAGTLILTGFDSTGKGPGSNLHWLTINFTAGTTTGDTPVSLGVTTLATELGITIGTPNGTGATVTIGNPTVNHTLMVSKVGSGSGTVTSSPAGIDCGSDCTQDYLEGTAVILTATPAAGSTFGGWSGDADCSDGSVTMSADRSCIATFTLASINHTLMVSKVGSGSGTVTSSPAGIDCGSDCTQDYLEGTAVILTATPATGSTFGGWSGDADCSDGSVTMSANRSCIATFTLAAAGDVWLDPATPTVALSANFTLEIRVDSGTDKVGAYTFNLGFDPSRLQVNAGVGDNGVQVGADGMPVNVVNLDNGAGTLTLTGFDATGKGPGSNLHWLTINFTAGTTTGDTPVSLGVTTLATELGITIGTPNGTGAMVTIGNPTVNHTLMVSKAGSGSGTVTSSPAGIDCGSDCTQDYLEGTAVILTATPAAGSTFGGWSGDADCSDGSVTMSADRSCIATFTLALINHTLMVSKVGSGSGTVTSSPAGIDCGSDCTQDYLEGTAVILTATPAAGSTFGGWSGDADCSDGSVTMSANRSCIATFTMAAAGDVWLDPATQTVALSTNFTLEIRVDSGTDKVGAYTFNLGFDPSRLQVNAGVGDNGVQVGADGMPVNVVNLDNVAGTLILTGFDATGKGPGSNLHWLTINFTAGTTTGDTPVSLGVTTLATELGITIGTPNGTGAMVTIGNPTVNHTLTVIRAGSGTVTSSPAGIDCGSTCAADFKEGESVNLTAVPDSSWTQGSWAWTGGACIGGTTCIIKMSEPKTANVEFKCELIQIEDNTQSEWECRKLEVVDGSGFEIAVNDDVTFRAEHSIILGKSFTVKEGGVFHILMTN